MAHTHALLGLQILIRCQLTVRSNHIKIWFLCKKSKTWPLLELGGGQPFCQGLPSPGHPVNNLGLPSPCSANLCSPAPIAGYLTCQPAAWAKSPAFFQLPGIFHLTPALLCPIFINCLHHSPPQWHSSSQPLN